MQCDGLVNFLQWEEQLGRQFKNRKRRREEEERDAVMGTSPTPPKEIDKEYVRQSDSIQPSWLRCRTS